MVRDGVGVGGLERVNSTTRRHISLWSLTLKQTAMQCVMRTINVGLWGLVLLAPQCVLVQTSFQKELGHGRVQALGDCQVQA